MSAPLTLIHDLLRQEAHKMDLALSDDNIEAMELFASEMIKWNKRINLTAITTSYEITAKHFIDSLQLARFINEDDVLMDIGSGAGFPVIPLKIVRPKNIMFSVDAVAKKIAFQRHVIRLLRLQGIESLHARVENLDSTHSGKYSLIISRAFTRLDRFVSLAAPLLKENGRLIAMKGLHAEDEISATRDSLGLLGYSLRSKVQYQLPGNMGERSLSVIMADKAL